MVVEVGNCVHSGLDDKMSGIIKDGEFPRIDFSEKHFLPKKQSQTAQHNLKSHLTIAGLWDTGISFGQRKGPSTEGIWFGQQGLAFFNFNYYFTCTFLT